MKYILSLLSILFYLIIQFIVYYFYIKYINVDVVFYDSLITVLISLTVFGISLFSIKNFSAIDNLNKINLIIIAGLIGYCLAISLPTVIDRSLSFYILEKLQQRGGGIQLDKFNYIFTNEYMREHKLIDIRLTEQKQSGTIVIINDCVKLTEKGDQLANFSIFFRETLLPKSRLLNGIYTDELINPFERSDSIPDYLCK
jgi:hypothetical protein